MRPAKWGRPDRGQGGRNGLAVRGYRGRQGLGYHVEGNKTENAEREVEADGNGRLFCQAVQYRNEGGKSVAKSGAGQSQGDGWEGES